MISIPLQSVMLQLYLYWIDKKTKISTCNIQFNMTLVCMRQWCSAIKTFFVANLFSVSSKSTQHSILAEVRRRQTCKPYLFRTESCRHRSGWGWSQWFSGVWICRDNSEGLGRIQDFAIKHMKRNIFNNILNTQNTYIQRLFSQVLRPFTKFS